MGSSYLSLLIFIIATIFYFFVLKGPQLTPDILQNEAAYLSYQKGLYSKLLIYFLIVVLTQFGVNIGAIISTCGGSVSQNVGSAALLTFIPWILIFGVVIAVLIVFPGWKSAFSNVVGYFVVSGQANTILSELLVVSDVNQPIQDAAGGDPKKRDALEEAASAIIKLTGNMSLLINQIVPSNFMQYWGILTPLMKEQYQTNIEEASALQQKLLNIVVLRDNVGEAMWYIYTAILLTSIVQYNISTRACKPDIASLNANQQIFQEQQQAVQDSNAAAQSTIYSH
uniref:Uncharacterized protein n=1 Tax=viral metagenome TaxID=1070528 RepID=A0A6C0B9B9_9ZZZZ